MTTEFLTKARSGWLVLGGLLLAMPLGIYGLVLAIQAAIPRSGPHEMHPAFGIVGMALVLLTLIVLWTGFFSLQPNEAAVLLLFGSYKGTVRHAGFWWAN